MKWIFSNLLIFLSYGFLYCSVLLLWVPCKAKFPYWASALLLAILFGLMSPVLALGSVTSIAALAIAVYYSRIEENRATVRILAAMGVVIVSIGLAAHQFPGFNNLIVVDEVFISWHSIPFTLYLDFDKSLIGILILGLSCTLISNKKEWVTLFEQIKWKIPLIIFVIIILACLLKLVRWDPKLPSSLLLWGLTNLLFVCVAEEAFFRGFIQKNISLMMVGVKYGEYWAIAVASVLFGLAHYSGGMRYAIIATVAGVGYGWIYSYTKRIEGSILTHFSLNLTHFLFFTYPVLSSAV